MPAREAGTKETLKAFDADRIRRSTASGIIRGLVVKTHGSAKAKEVCNSIIQCITFKEQKINDKIMECIQTESRSDE